MKNQLATLAYGVADAATLHRGVPRRINGEAIRFPARWSRYYASTYEVEKHHFLRAHVQPGTLAIDIGAHLGVFTIVMARGVGATGLVASFEPTPSIRAALEQMVLLNGLAGQVEIRDEAMWSNSGRLTLACSAAELSNANSLLGAHDSSSSIVVRTISIDEYVAESPRRVSCIKIDAEGAEVDIVEGAGAVLREYSPALAIELHPQLIDEGGRRLRELGLLLSDHGFQMLRDGRFLHSDELGEISHPCEIQAIRPAAVA